MKLEGVYSYKNCSIEIKKEILVYDIKLIDLNTTNSVHLRLEYLWFIEGVDRDDWRMKFNEGDFFQHTFNATPSRNGLASLLHDFIIEEILPLDGEIKNIYSTNIKGEEENYIISPYAITFWKKREEKNKAVFIPEFSRYQILKINTILH